jgi:protein-S-isoprenylcysteine O-methyltransferase Ste14
LRASRFEFEHRFLIIAAIVVAGFAMQAIDEKSIASRIVEWLAPGAAITDATAQHILHITYTAGAAIILVAAGLRTWATAYLRAEVVHDTRLHSERLVADGPFRRVRNPLYLGVLLLFVGMAPILSLAGTVWILAVLAIFLRRLIAGEEHELLAQVGDSFQRYLDAVPMIIPALSPRLPPSGARPQWRRALLGELFVWIFALAFVLLAVTLELRWTRYLCLAGVVSYPIMQRRLRSSAS